MTVTLPSADIFTRISDASEKARLLTDLASSRGELLAKRTEPAADVFVLMAITYNADKLICRIAGATSSLPPTGELILNFFIGGEKYFMQADYLSMNDQVVVSSKQNLYHLQRREDYRIRIPANYKALLEIVSINGQTKKCSIPIADLSGGGCRIHIDPKVLALKTQDELKGHLFLPDRNPIQVVGSVRHLRSENHGKGPHVCGIQFIGLTEPLKNRIIAVVMDLYREFFAGRT